MESDHLDRRARPDWLAVDHWRSPKGWDLRRFRSGPNWTGSILFQTGRADFFEKYLEAIAHWRALGWSVEGFDWRGQGGSGRLLVDPHVGHAPPFGLLVQDLAAYVDDWLARTSGPHVLIAHSMGAHLVLRLLAERAPKVDGVVLLSPMLGLRAGLLPEPLARLITRIACGLGYGKRPVWKSGNEGSGHRQRNLTHDVERFEDEMWWRRSDPLLDVGPPTWKWMLRAWNSIARLKAREVIERIDTPVLVLYAEKDRLVRASAIRKLCARLPNARLRSHRDAAHELLREADEVRDWADGEIDGFLKAIAT